MANEGAFLIFLVLPLLSTAVNWNGNNWAHGCDFNGADLSNAHMSGDRCGGTCAATSGCTHFTWTNYNGGTCWMKKGPISKHNAFDTSDHSVVCGVIIDSGTTNNIEWNGNNWALGCDFNGADLSNARISGDLCGGTCAATSGCTHFTWTNYNGGTCWMKKGPISKDKAISNSDHSNVCGIIIDSGSSDSSKKKDSGSTDTSTKNGVLTTHHGATEHGACKLPEGSYAAVNPVALGDIDTLGTLKYRNAMCGHVLQIDCGHGPLDIIVINSNLGGGLDLYRSSWNKATGKAPPGQKWCKVAMTNRNPFTFEGPRCYYEPDSEKFNDYYKLLGLFNTGDKIVKSASLDGKVGSFNGVQPYFAFGGGKLSQNAKVTFNFEDGSSHIVNLRDCVRENRAHIWS